MPSLAWGSFPADGEKGGAAVPNHKRKAVKQMIVSVETALLRFKRRMEAWLRSPWVRAAAWGLGALLGAMVLAAGAVQGKMQPIALGLTAAAPGLYCIPASLGSALGYRLFWGRAGLQGVSWSALALALRLGIDTWYHGDQRAGHLAAGTACLVSAAGLVFQLLLRDNTPLGMYILRIAIGAGSVWLFTRCAANRSGIARYLTFGTAVLALAGVRSPGWCNPGLVAAGVLAGAEALPASAMAGLGLDLAGVTRTPMTAALCLSAFFRLLPVKKPWRQMLAPGCASLTVMVLSGSLDPPYLAAVTAGGVLGALIPWSLDPLSRHTGTGAAQVQLEQLARTMGTLQREMLDLSPPEPDEEAVADRVRINACGSCSLREHCMEKDRIDGEIFRDPFRLECRKPGRLLAELRRGREQLRWMHADRARQGEYRAALLQQYGFLADTLRTMADRLPGGGATAQARFRLQASSRSRKREASDGDRCTAFPGPGVRYFMLLCDGMGTGLAAAQAAETATGLLQRLLKGGVPAQHALGCLNAQLTLGDRAGAVTVDLAEIRLDTGQVSVYKWGAAPSYLIRRGTAEKIGTAAPPPGFGETRETAARLSLCRGEVLVLISDGVEMEDAPAWAEQASQMPTGELAERILDESAGEDDATAVVIRLLPVSATP